MSDTSGLHDHLGYWLRRLSDEVHGRFEAELDRHDVTVSQWGVMVSVFHGHDTTKAVAAHMDIDPGAVSRLVDRLAGKGLIRREPDPASRRTVRLVLTERGRTLVPELAELADRNDAHYFGSLDAGRRRQLEEWIRNLVGEARPAPHNPSERRER
ncbi:MarR family winged helix-turn-helix transcriptional regulator [Streptomyces alanosinicus]|uniref:MarR family transcriptional regulator n=1 Tax=Streptomyces alanosinicus TaxID=68171 RepID=A0A918YM94_9ACTN|nr:MarR family transcriptional regulator [Streptomyces alanosinicus]GHE08469.1 MarR family transcriptional regulator [Streptomyces alanosinicus]